MRGVDDWNLPWSPGGWNREFVLTSEVYEYGKHPSLYLPEELVLAFSHITQMVDQESFFVLYESAVQTPTMGMALLFSFETWRGWSRDGAFWSLANHRPSGTDPTRYHVLNVMLWIEGDLGVSARFSVGGVTQTEVAEEYPALVRSYGKLRSEFYERVVDVMDAVRLDQHRGDLP